MKRKSFATLIKLQKTHVDAQRQHLARLQEHLARVQERLRQLALMKEQEQRAAERDPVARMTYGEFLRRLVSVERDVEKERQKAVQAVQIAHDKLAELFEEQKRYEIAEEQRIEEEEAEELRLERIELDEIGGMAHERKRAG